MDVGQSVGTEARVLLPGYILRRSQEWGPTAGAPEQRLEQSHFSSLHIGALAT